MTPHEKHLIEDCVKNAKRQAGVGWSLLGDVLKQGLVAAEVLRVLQARDGIPGGSWQAAADFAHAGLIALD